MSYFKQYLSEKLPDTTISAGWLASIVGLKRSEACRLWLNGTNAPQAKFLAILEEKLGLDQDEIKMVNLIDNAPNKYKEELWKTFRTIRYR